MIVGDERSVAGVDQRPRRHGEPRRSAPLRRRLRREADRRAQAVLHAPRRAALDRDRIARDADGAGVSAGRLRGAAAQGHPRQPDGAREPGRRARRPRPRGRMVLPAPEGQDRLGSPAAPLAALLGQVRPPRQQPRRRAAQAGADARDAGRVLQVAADRRPRPARVDPAALDLDRHRALQREPRAERLLRVAHDRLPRGRDAHRLRHARRLDLRLRRGLGAPLCRLGRAQPQRDRPRLRDLRQRHRRDRASDGSTPTTTATPAAP